MDWGRCDTFYKGEKHKTQGNFSMTYRLGGDVGGTFTDLLLQCLNNFQRRSYRLLRVILMGGWIAEVNQQSIH